MEEMLILNLLWNKKFHFTDNIYLPELLSRGITFEYLWKVFTGKYFKILALISIWNMLSKLENDNFFRCQEGMFELVILEFPNDYEVLTYLYIN